MKRLVVFIVVIGTVLMASSSFAQQKYPLGDVNIAVKVDYFRFSDSGFKDIDLENMVFIGGEWYVPVFRPNLYFGIEVGWAGTDSNVHLGAFDIGAVHVNGSDFKFDLDYVPIEFNSKYVFEISSCLTLDVGGGISLNYFNLEEKLLNSSFNRDGWIFGGQFFSSLNYKYKNWFFGLNAKYQLTEDAGLNETGLAIVRTVGPGGVVVNLRRFNIINVDSFDNFRVGGQVGLMF